MSRRMMVAVMAVLVVVVVMALIGAQSMFSTVGQGPEGARVLQDRLRTACGAVAAEDPPLRAFAMVPKGEGGGWRWKVEATLRQGKSPADADVGRAVERVLASCLATPVRGKPPEEILLLLHVPGKGDWARTFDGEGRPR